ncbi:MAG: YabP/YqfC family sporulation protein [Lachnospiraceae bacterium]|nr:YabP/YqfC family sporulation protein [Lachnospiraceae bacterium]
MRKVSTVSGNLRPGKSRSKPGRDRYKEIEKQEKKLHKERETRLEQLAGQIRLPADMVAGVPIVTIIGTGELRIENYKGILGYTDTLIRIQAKPYGIIVEGKRLEIAYFTRDEMKITGMIHSVTYQNDTIRRGV